jgi:hypothetical protein
MASDTAWLGHDDFIPAADATIAIPPPAQTNAIACDPPTVERTVHVSLIISVTVPPYY